MLRKLVYSISAVAMSFLQVNAQQKRPNIIFIPIDDLRPDLSCYGNKTALTPNFQTLADNGVVFLNAYCQQAVCNPSRVSLLTGLRPDKTKVWDLNTDFRINNPNLITLPQYFKNNGYQTVGIGKTFHNIFEDNISWTKEPHVDGFPFDPDAVYAGKENIKIINRKKAKILEGPNPRFDKYGQIYVKANATDSANVNDDVYYDGAQTDMAIKELKALKDKNEPFFLSVGFYKPHLPFCAPQKYWDLYDRSKLPLAGNPYMPQYAPTYAVNGDAELRNYEDFHDLPFPAEAPLSVARQRELIHGYYACISYIDAQLGKLMQSVKDLGLADNTIIVLWADHGYKLGEHNSWSKQSNFDIDTKVPLIFSGNLIQNKGKEVKAPVELIDIYPTLVELANLPAKKDLDGKSLAKIVAGNKISVNKPAFSQFLMGRFGAKDPQKDNQKMGYTVRNERYRYTVWYEWQKDDTRGKKLNEEFYDHETDKNEDKNVIASANKTILQHLESQLNKNFLIK